MTGDRGDSGVQNLLAALQERAKELNCLYAVEEILRREDEPPDAIFPALVEAIPRGWQYPDVCRARLIVGEDVYETENFRDTVWKMEAPFHVQGEVAGRIGVWYDEVRPAADEGPFLAEERRLLETIAERVGYYLLHRRLVRALQDWDHPGQLPGEGESLQWGVVLDFLRRTDQGLLARLTRKMINRLVWDGVPEAADLLGRLAPTHADEEPAPLDENRPSRREAPPDRVRLADDTFRVAERHLGNAEIVTCIQTWINEDKTGHLASVLERAGTTLPEIVNALERYQAQDVDPSALPSAVLTELRVSLLRRFFSEHLDYLSAAKSIVEVGEFAELAKRIVSPTRSHGKLGGKSAGLFLASQIVRHGAPDDDKLGRVHVPRTWYVASDGLLEFIHANSLEDLYNRKYMEIDRVRQDYPQTIQLLKNSQFPPEIVKGLSVALDEFGKVPLIVRSSSLLEDRTGAAFSGKYKSLFLANQGSKRERLEALLDAVAEVYASIFGPDPIEYRAERGLLDVHEEMGLLIQEVVGRRCGDWFFPLFSGVAFSNNEFRWSPRIRRKDGLVRMVPGLGTRAVDRLGDDYPVLVSPGQPSLRVNQTVDEIVRYSPRMMDVINLRSNRFETVAIRELLAKVGNRIPQVRRILSHVEGDRLTRPLGLTLDFEADDWVVTFEGLFRETPFLEGMSEMLDRLRQATGTPIDIEFAHDGERFHLLQCRAQSYTPDAAPAPIPQDVPRSRVLFTANRHVSNGRVPDVTHVVYVDPEAYGALDSLSALQAVGRAVGRLNQVLPKRQFVLMGPGRWGSRGDVKLGVSVGYSDINNTAVLIEIARQKGGYVPDLSFGTHFFQDLVEAGIRYLPLYPDEEGVAFQEAFFRRSPSVLSELVPEFAGLDAVVRVIDVPRVAEGRVLRILMNADLRAAIGMLAEPSRDATGVTATGPVPDAHAEDPDHWRWRLFMAERLASDLDADSMGVRGMWVIGSTKNASAGPASDLDLIVHFEGTEAQRHDLECWLEGWSLSLSEFNFLRTGYRSGGLLDVHWVTDEDFERQTSFAAKVGAVTDPARPLPLGGRKVPRRSE